MQVHSATTITNHTGSLYYDWYTYRRQKWVSVTLAQLCQQPATLAYCYVSVWLICLRPQLSASHTHSCEKWLTLLLWVWSFCIHWFSVKISISHTGLCVLKSVWVIPQSSWLWYTPQSTRIFHLDLWIHPGWGKLGAKCFLFVFGKRHLESFRISR